MSTQAPSMATSPADALRARGGRGRGHGPGGSVRIPVPRPTPSSPPPSITRTTSARGLTPATRGRHSSYTPAEDPSPSPPRSPVLRGRGRGAGMGAGARPSPDGVAADDHSVAVRRMGGSHSVRRPSSSSYAGGPGAGLAARGRPPSPGPARSGRLVPKFTDMDGEDEDAPPPPPRSPRVSPRLTRLPALPPRPRASAPSAPSVGGTSREEGGGEEGRVEDAGAKEEKRAAMRSKCVSEIYQTEKDYIEDLEILINVFIFPMRTMASVDDKALYAIFSNVEVFIACNKEMLAQLETVVQGTPPGQDEVIGFVFTQLADYFKMYKVYCANQATSLSTVESMSKKNGQFKKMLDVCHSDARCRGLFLQSFLIKPIQRVCKYPLLLRELIRYTPESHPDWEPLQAAFSKINSVVADINEAQRQAEGLQRILDLQSLIDGVDSLVAPGRNYVKEGELTQYKSSKSKSGEKRHVFFFTDLILLTQRRGEKRFEHKLSVDLDSCKIVVLADSSYIKNSFELSTGESKGKKCILSGETPDDSNQWIKEIRGLIKSYQKRKLEDMRRHQG